MTKKTAMIAVALVAATFGSMMGATEADAGKRSGGYYYYNSFDTGSRPARGYEGFAGVGKYGAYCSYRREPERRCWVTRSGRERCRIVNWRLIQHCY